MKIFIIMLYFLSLIYSSVYSMAGEAGKIPLKPLEKSAISNGEFLHYGIYVAKEKTADLYFVTIISNLTNNGNCAFIYYHTINLNRSKKLPSRYPDFSSRFIISLRDGSILETLYNDPETTNEGVSGGNPPVFYRYLTVDKKQKQVLMESKVWDGYEIKSYKNRVNFTPGFPLWDGMGCLLIVQRFLDIKNPGVMYVTEPGYIKDPVPGYIRPLKNERLKVRAGEFDTIHCIYVIADPFVGRLLDSYSREAYMSVENSDRRLMVFMHTAVGTDFELEEISNVINKN